MRFVYKKSVNAQLLKGDNIILAAIGAQLVQSYGSFPSA